MREFARLLFAASSDALRGRNLLVFNTRFGYLRGGEVLSAEQIGLLFGISRVRVRQIISKALTRIRWKGARELKRGRPDSPCARLFFYICAELGPVVTPDTVLSTCRKMRSGDEWSLAYLLVNLLMPGSDHRRSLLSRLKNKIQVQAATPFPLPQAPVCVTI